MNPIQRLTQLARGVANHHTSHYALTKRDWRGQPEQEDRYQCSQQSHAPGMVRSAPTAARLGGPPREWQGGLAFSSLTELQVRRPGLDPQTLGRHRT